MPWRPAELQIPLRGWIRIVWRTGRGVGDDALDMVARSIAFAAIMGLFPMLAALVSLYGLFADPAVVWRHLDLLAGALPPDGHAWLGEEVMRLAQTADLGLGLAFFIGLGVGIWSGNIAMRALIRGLNIAYGLAERRSFLRLNLTTLALMLGAIVFTLVTAAVAVVLPLLERWIWLPPGIRLLAWLRWPALLALSIVVLAVLYRLGPSRQVRPRGWLSVGVVAAALGWLLGSALYALLIARFGDLERTYGSLAALFGFLAWTWLSAFVVLVGAKLDAETQRYLAADAGGVRS